MESEDDLLNLLFKSPNSDKIWVMNEISNEQKGCLEKTYLTIKTLNLQM